MTWFSLLKTGGVTVIVLILCSVLSWTVAIERLFYFWQKSRLKRSDFMLRIHGEIKKGDTRRAMEVSSHAEAPFAQVIHAGLSFYKQGENAIRNAMERAIAVETTLLEKNTAVNGTIGSVAVYIGLFGTVLGIIRAFHDISTTRSGDLHVVINGISEALICTAVGLLVAVPAVIVYNYFMKRIETFVTDMELCASELADILREAK